MLPALPVSTEEVEAALLRMEEAGLVHRYKVQGQRFLAVDPGPFYKAQPYIAKAKRAGEGSAFPPPPDPPWGKKEGAALLNTNCCSVSDFADLSVSPSPSPSKIKVKDPQPEKRLGADASPATTLGGTVSLEATASHPCDGPLIEMAAPLGEEHALPLTDVRRHGPPSAPAHQGGSAVIKAPLGFQPPRAASRKKMAAPEEREPPPPAVEAFRRIAGIYPVRSWWPEIESAVGGNGELARWEETVKAYVGLGWNRGNVANMLDFYRRGTLPQTSSGHADRRLREGTPHASPKAEAWLRLSEQMKKESAP
ncbi:MAG: hypothetical protein WCP58_09240 [bacterium]